MSDEINIVEIRSREGKISGTTFWNSQVELLSDEAIIELLNRLHQRHKARTKISRPQKPRNHLKIRPRRRRRPHANL